MRERKIHFKGEPFMIRIYSEGDEPIECTPIVSDDPWNCGLGVSFGEGKHLVWGLASPRNLISAWRGTEVLRHLEAIGPATLCSTYYTGMRNPHQSDMESRVEPTIENIGRAVYDEIMARPVPEVIIRAVLDNQKDSFPPALYPITDEVRAGTIQWRQEFADAGIKHPDDIDAKRQAQEEMIKKFDLLLVSYARSRNLPRECNGMWNVEGALLTLIEMGADKTHSDRVVVALAGVLGELSVREFSMFMMPFGRSSVDFHKELEKSKEEAITHSAKWLKRNSPSQPWYSFLLFWRRTNNSVTRSNEMELLAKLFDEYFPTKLQPIPA